MGSAVDRVQMRLQEAMEQGSQASLGQAIDASKGVNGLKQLRRSAKVLQQHYGIYRLYDSDVSYVICSNLFKPWPLLLVV